MEFDPTNDYYGMDISHGINRLKWNFWEFIKNLVTLSSPSNLQKEIIGLGAVADEMATDFESYYTLSFQTYLDNELLTKDQVSKLNLLDKFLEDRSGNKMPEFWNDELLDLHPDWEEVRKMAKDILIDLEYDNLKIDIERTTQQSSSKKGEPLIMQTTKTRLIKKTAS